MSGWTNVLLAEVRPCSVLRSKEKKYIKTVTANYSFFLKILRKIAKSGISLLNKGYNIVSSYFKAPYTALVLMEGAKRDIGRNKNRTQTNVLFLLPSFHAGHEFAL